MVLCIAAGMARMEDLMRSSSWYQLRFARTSYRELTPVCAVVIWTYAALWTKSNAVRSGSVGGAMSGAFVSSALTAMVVSADSF